MDKKKVVGVASDHAGYEYKEALKKHIEAKGFEVIDYGTYSNESTSYAIYGKKLGLALHNHDVDYGVGVCGTGLGISYALNRYTKVRAARVTTVEDAHLARQHNDANALAIGQRTNTLENAKAMVDEFFQTNYEGGRHQTRIDGLDQDLETCDNSVTSCLTKSEIDKVVTACETQECSKVSQACNYEKDKVVSSCQSKAVCCTVEDNKVVTACEKQKSCCPQKLTKSCPKTC